MLARLLAELGYVGADAAASGLSQPHPITIGRENTINPDQSGEIALLNMPSFPIMGRVWCVNVQTISEPVPSKAGAPLLGVVALPVPQWLSLRIRWTQGSATAFYADLDLVAGSAAFPVLCDSLQVYAISTPPDPVPPDALPVRLITSVGQQGSRITAIPRRTVYLGELIKLVGTRTVGIPARATEVTLASLDATSKSPQQLGLEFFDWLGNAVGSTYLSPTSTPRPIDLPQGASIVTVTNIGPDNTLAALQFRIAL